MAETRRWYRFATEGLAIVASILVAFGIDAWWAGRQVLAEEQELLTGLVEEFEGNASLVDQTLERGLRARADLQHFLSLSSDELRSPGLALTFASAYEPFIRTYSVTPTVGFLHATISSGKLAIIRDVDLRAALARFDGLFSDASELTWFTNELNLRAAERLGELEEIRAVLARESDIGDTLFEQLTLSPATVREMHDDPELMRVATAKLRYWDGYFFEVRAFRQEIDAVLALLAANLANRS